MKGKMELILKEVQDVLKQSKVKDIVTLDVEGRSYFYDRMLIASGTSSRQITSLSDKICDLLKRKYNIVTHTEGLTKGEWVLIDAGEISIHLFQDEAREKYNLEELWG